MGDRKRAGDCGDVRAEPPRPARGFVWMGRCRKDPVGGHPGDGITVEVDGDAGAVRAVEDTGVLSVPRADALGTSASGAVQQRRAPRDPVPAEGPGFRLDETGKIRGRRWTLEIGSTGREGWCRGGSDSPNGADSTHPVSNRSVGVGSGPWRSVPPPWRRDAMHAGERRIGEKVGTVPRASHCPGEICRPEARTADATGRIVTRPTDSPSPRKPTATC
jgi:Cu2+-containing amine oxidase